MEFRSFTWLRTTLAAAALLVLFAAPSAWAKKPLRVRMDTTEGPIILELYPDKAPETVKNFLDYVDGGYYEGTIFHRVIEDFMIQGGGLDKYLQPKYTVDPIANEADNGLENKPYTIAMARTGDPHSATSQFFINVADNRSLNFKSKTPQGWGYCVFGKVVGGRPTVDKIKRIETRPQGPHRNVPVKTVTITKVAVQ